MSDGEHSFGWTSDDEKDSNSDEEESSNIVSRSSEKFTPANIMVKKEREDSPVDESFYNETYNGHDISNGYSFKRSADNSIEDGENALDQEVLKKFLDENPNLRPTPVSQTDLITENDDLWLIQCPPRFDVDSLVRLRILDHDKSKLKIPNSKLECVNIDKDSNQDITMILPATAGRPCTINNYTIKGKYVVRERMKTAISVRPEEEQTTTVPFPDNLKIRHPLFGGDYKKHIKLPSVVCERLANPPTRSLKSHKKYKTVQEPVVKEEEVHDTTVTKQHKKRKGSPGLLDDTVKSKKMKMAQKMWETETSIEKSLFDSPIIKKKKIKKESSN
ncbi:uncharacterized protein LOC143910330 [Arctopsyche grandis]|uniref:uncharacterized protein LOC143910330 n=1 Tax=Arctopsyche grandis TaxID=121162 RepID=UPI00406D9B60